MVEGALAQGEGGSCVFLWGCEGWGGGGEGRGWGGGVRCMLLVLSAVRDGDIHGPLVSVGVALCMIGGCGYLVAMEMVTQY